MTRTELVEFWATGCRPSWSCHQAVQQLRSANELAMPIRAIDAWDAPLDVARHRIIRLPTLLLLVDGVEQARCSPQRPTPATITAWVLEHLPRDDVAVTPATAHASPSTV